MESMLGYLASVLIGVSLGLIGGGGSILTVPVLVYLFHIEPSLATAYSLFIVGSTSLVGAIGSGSKGAIDYRVAAIFAVPSFMSVYLTRRLVLPQIPLEMSFMSTFVISRDTAIMILFAVIMFAAAFAMIRKPKVANTMQTDDSLPIFKIVAEGVVVGFLTGLVGAGGGFLIIPALVVFANLPMKKAVGTSLLIIAAKSLFGFMGDISSGQPINFSFLLIISTIAIFGIFIGGYFSGRVDGQKLRSAFGWFVMAIGIIVLFVEIAR